MGKRIVQVTPSDAFADNEIGDVVDIGGNLYCLVGRDPWKAYCVRYYWFDQILGRLFEWRRNGKLHAHTNSTQGTGPGT